MESQPYLREDEHQYMNGVLVYWDRRNSRVKIIPNQLLSRESLHLIKSSAAAGGVGKIISFAPEPMGHLFEAEGYVVEGLIPAYFQGETAICCSYFVDPSRAVTTHSALPDWGLNMLAHVCRDDSGPSQRLYTVREARERDIAAMIRLFRYIFQSYPSPIFESDYIRHNMLTESVLYKLALHKGEIIGIASAEMDAANLNAEMTDCVTYPQYRNRGVLRTLLNGLEAHLRGKGYICLYTLCRATNPAVNIAFTRQGYKYSGRMVNNCHICGAYEDMNILVKTLHPRLPAINP